MYVGDLQMTNKAFDVRLWECFGKHEWGNKECICCHINDMCVGCAGAISDYIENEINEHGV